MHESESSRLSYELSYPQEGVLLLEITSEMPVLPHEAKEFVDGLPNLSGPHIVLISGRCPVWLYGMVMHAAHATKAIATFDPRLEGYVVVQSHSDYKVGSVLPCANFATS